MEGAEWSNNLLDPNTFEWQDLADRVRREVRRFGLNNRGDFMYKRD